MWNNKVQASPQQRCEWLVPAFFLALAAGGAFAFGFTIVG